MMKFFTFILSLLLTTNFIYANESNTLLEYEKNTTKVFEDNVASVVNVSNLVTIKNYGFFSLQEEKKEPVGTGSGFIWDKEGHIVTNFHVVQKSQEFQISFHNDKKQYKAKLVGVEPRKDIALLKLVELPDNLKPIKIAESSKQKVGQKAMALGSPFGLNHTITTGIISAMGRSIKGIAGVDIKNMIQTDASINPGNSGGPLYNSLGEVIGMNTMIMSRSGSSAGVGFAVPSDSIKRIVPQLIKYGKVKQAGLGIVPLEDRYKRYFNLKKGLVIKEVLENSSAKEVGLKGIIEDEYGRYKLGDVILKIDDIEINDYNDIYHALEKRNEGEKVTVHVLRDDKVEKLKVELMILE